MIAPIGLYAGAGQLVAAPAAFDLDTPQQVDGKTVFRCQFMLKLPAAAFAGDRLALSSDSALAVRFSPKTITVAASDPDWIASLDFAESVAKVRLSYPAPVVQVDAHDDWEIGLYRVDGEAVSGQATVSGITNRPLSEAFVGPAFAVELVRRIQEVRGGGGASHPIAKTTRVAAAPAQPQGTQTQARPKVSAALLDPLAGLRFEAKPASPRLRLILPGQGARAEELLWQELLPGEQSSPVTLPANAAVGDVWQAAFERLPTLLAPEPGKPPQDATLRLEIESDAPCGIEIAQASFALEAEAELLAEPVTLRFDGSSRSTREIDLGKAVEILAQPVRLTVGLSLAQRPGAAAPDEPLPAGNRVGCLLDADQRMTLAWDLDAPGYVGGIACPWHPLAAALAGKLRLFADAGGMPGPQPLAESEFELDSAEAGWLALRWPALPLQSGRYWLELALKQGAGLWLADSQGAASEGWTERARAPGEPRQALALALALRPLLTGSEAAGPGGLELSLNGAPLSAAADSATIEFGGATPSKWVLSATSGKQLTATVKSVRLTYRV